MRALKKLSRSAAVLLLVGLSACGYRGGVIEVANPAGGCSNRPVCGTQTHTAHLFAHKVSVTFTNNTAVPVSVGLQGPDGVTPLGAVQAAGTLHASYLRPSLYRGRYIELVFIAQALGDDGQVVAATTIPTRLGRHQQVLAVELSGMRLPEGLRR